MADSAVSILDSAGVARLVDAQTIGTDFQQTVTIGDGINAGRTVNVAADGALEVQSNVATVSALTNITSSVTSGTIVAANTTRRGLILFNDSTSLMYVSYSTSATSATAFTVRLAAGGLHFMDVPVYTGALTGMWSAANGFCRVTDLSA